MSPENMRLVRTFRTLTQPENRTFSHFSQRTDSLALALGCNLEDLPEKLGISRRMFFGYRSGQYPISKKAWEKLSKAETENPIITLKDQLVEYRTTKSAKSANLTESERIERLEKTVEKLESILERVAKAFLAD
ncbi:hypothetical protein JIN85_16990 [Luteolibacter pohnpeiensis]|uniref:Uncharacterized protein n=1 Tax=Luteolibacter pohnpeiensis TaxID=454153 RepID=A0A934VY30_9BACT|nr:hypothetical protein [Luteolibacter pohnpeiensis]MBK1884119.1 hypothetical protein [Luteolibacter pohnpeiensis]